MKRHRIILVINGTSASEHAPNFISIVRQEKTGEYILVSERRSVKRGGPESFPVDFQGFVRQGVVVPEAIDLIAILIGPGSFTGLRASIAFASGMQMGLDCPVVALRRGEVLFPILEKHYAGKTVWHMTAARRNRVFIESNQDSEVKAYDFSDIPWPETELVLAGEAVYDVNIPSALSWIKAGMDEADAIRIAEMADRYWQKNQVTNPLCPLYIDPPKAALPAGGLRKLSEG